MLTLILAYSPMSFARLTSIGYAPRLLVLTLVPDFASHSRLLRSLLVWVFLFLFAALFARHACSIYTHRHPVIGFK